MAAAVKVEEVLAGCRSEVERRSQQEAVRAAAAAPLSVVAAVKEGPVSAAPAG